MRVLLIAEQDTVAHILSTKSTGFSVNHASSTQAGLVSVSEDAQYDVIVIDVVSDDIDFIAILNKLKNEMITAPVLILSTDGTEESKVRALEHGAMRYIGTPCNAELLITEILTLARFTYNLNRSPTAIGKTVLQFKTNAVIVDGRRIQLGPKECRLLAILLGNCEKIVQHDTIEWGLYNDNEGGVNARRSIHNLVGTLRKKIESSQDIRIDSIIGEGYRLTVLPIWSGTVC